MRVSNLFSRTLFEKTSSLPAGLQRLQRAGYLRQISPTRIYFPNPGMALLQRMESLLTEKLEKMNAQRIKVPISDCLADQLNAEVISSNLFVGFHQSLKSELQLIADIASREIHSYRQLPAILFSIQPNPSREKPPDYLWPFNNELTQMTVYLFAENESQLKEIHQKLHLQLLDFFKMIGLSPVPTILNPDQPDSIEFIVFHHQGNRQLIQCPHCRYQAEQIHAQISKPLPATEPPLTIEKVATPETTTIEALAKLLNISKSRTAKAIFRMAEIVEEGQLTNKFVFAVIRGDMELNEFKLARAIGARNMQPADESQILETGAVPGYASPIGLKNVLVVVDDLIPKCANLVAGANEKGFHLLNTNFGRDFQATGVTDIIMARVGDPCPVCSHLLQAANFFSLSGIHPSGHVKNATKPVTFLDSNGQATSVWLGVGWLYFEPIITFLAETCQDENGLCWPMAISPYQVYLIQLAGKQQDPLVIEKAETLYQSLLTAGIKVLFDDRIESPGVKFSDADLLGIPLRLTVSTRSLEQGGVEVKRRDAPEKKIIPLEEILTLCRGDAFCSCAKC